MDIWSIICKYLKSISLHFRIPHNQFGPDQTLHWSKLYILAIKPMTAELLESLDCRYREPSHAKQRLTISFVCAENGNPPSLRPPTLRVPLIIPCRFAGLRLLRKIPSTSTSRSGSSSSNRQYSLCHKRQHQQQATQPTTLRYWIPRWHE